MHVEQLHILIVHVHLALRLALGDGGGLVLRLLLLLVVEEVVHRRGRRLRRLAAWLILVGSTVLALQLGSGLLSGELALLVVDLVLLAPRSRILRCTVVYSPYIPVPSFTVDIGLDDILIRVDRFPPYLITHTPFVVVTGPSLSCHPKFPLHLVLIAESR